MYAVDLQTFSARGITPLQYAAQNGHTQLTQYLLSMGGADGRLLSSLDQFPPDTKAILTNTLLPPVSSFVSSDSFSFSICIMSCNIAPAPPSEAYYIQLRFATDVRRTSARPLNLDDVVWNEFFEFDSRRLYSYLLIYCWKVDSPVPIGFTSLKISKGTPLYHIISFFWIYFFPRCCLTSSNVV
jgi:ankyrin repeat protein